MDEYSDPMTLQVTGDLVAEETLEVFATACAGRQLEQGAVTGISDLFVQALSDKMSTGVACSQSVEPDSFIIRQGSVERQATVSHSLGSVLFFLQRFVFHLHSANYRASSGPGAEQCISCGRLCM